MSLWSSIRSAGARVWGATTHVGSALKDYLFSPIASAMHSYIVMSNIPRMIVDMRVKMSSRAFRFWASTLPFGVTISLLAFDIILGPSFSHMVHGIISAIATLFFAYLIQVGTPTDVVEMEQESHEADHHDENHEHHEEEGPDEPHIDFPWWGILIVAINMAIVLSTVLPYKIREARHHHAQHQHSHAKTWYDYLINTGNWLYNLLALPLCAYELAELALFILSAIAHDSKTNPEELGWEEFNIKIATLGVTTIVSLICNLFQSSREFKEKFSDGGLKLASFLWFYLKVFQPIPNDEVADSDELFHLVVIALCAIASGIVAHCRFGNEHHGHDYTLLDAHGDDEEESRVDYESRSVSAPLPIIINMKDGSEIQPLISKSLPLAGKYGSLWYKASADTDEQAVRAEGSAAHYSITPLTA